MPCMGGIVPAAAAHAAHAAHAAAAHAAAAHAAAAHPAAAHPAAHPAHAAAHAAHLAGCTLCDDSRRQDHAEGTIRAIGDRDRHPPVAGPFGFDGDEALIHRDE